MYSQGQKFLADLEQVGIELQNLQNPNSLDYEVNDELKKKDVVLLALQKFFDL